MSQLDVDVDDGVNVDDDDVDGSFLDKEDIDDDVGVGDVDIDDGCDGDVSLVVEVDVDDDVDTNDDDFLIDFSCIMLRMMTKASTFPGSPSTSSPATGVHHHQHVLIFNMTIIQFSVVTITIVIILASIKFANIVTICKIKILIANIYIVINFGHTVNIS